MDVDVNKLRKIKITFAGIYILFMSARAIFNPFITVYMQERGLTAETIGIIMAVNSFMIILSQPFWGIMADKLQSVKTTLVLCICFQAVFSFGLLYSDTFIPIALLFAMYTFFSSPEGPMLDTWGLKTLKSAGDEKAVGQIKLWGCLGFAAASILSGMYINNYSTHAVIPTFCAMLFLIAFILWRIRISAAPEKPLSLKDIQPGRIAGDYRYLIFLAYIFVMQLPHRAGYTFYPLLIAQLGGNKSMVGYTSAVMFVSEAMLLFLSKRLLTKVKPEYLIIGSSVFFILWQFLYSAVTLPQQVIWIALLDGPSYALFTIGTLYYMDHLAPKELRTTYQTIAYAVYFGLSGIAGNALGGWCIQHRGFKFMYLAGGLLIFVASSVFYAMIKKSDKNNRRSDKNAYLGTMR